MLFLLSLLPFLASADNNFCYTCASPELRSRWQLTGLPSMADQYFTACNTPSGSNLVKRESCPGPCFTMIFDDPDNQDSSSSANMLFVRGCHSILMQVTSNRTSSNGNSYCEVDNTYPMADSKGTIKPIKMLMEFCSQSDCNIRRNYVEPACTQQTTDLLNNQQVQCYDCNPKQGSNCNEGRCAKKYCMKRIVRLGGAYQMTKSCSNVNLAGVDNYCLNNDVISTPGGAAVKNRYIQCYCKDKQFCNEAFRPTHILSFCLLFFIV